MKMRSKKKLSNFVLVLIVMFPLLLKSQNVECEFRDSIYWVTNNYCQDFGDSLSIEKFSEFLKNFEQGNHHPDFGVDSILPRYYFPVVDFGDVLYIGRFLDEGEYLSITLYSILKKECKLIDKFILAEVTAWENGYREAFCIIKSKHEFICHKKFGSKDWGDGKLWSKTEKITLVNLTPEGEFKTEVLNKRIYYTSNEY
ncbi:MAG: hypothetical protein DWQ02_25420 [Bacteroidetes bacterium]|nr:MAG: hypothetical protein DWQ02_25420 [Bacteroidota bacterium]